MRDEHYYTRALKLNPENAIDYYLGRADFYCMEYDYDKAYKDFTKAQKLGANTSKSSRYKICEEYKNAEDYILSITDEINKTPENYSLYCDRAKYYLLKREYTKCLSDVSKAVQLCPCPHAHEVMGDICSKIKEMNVFDSVNNSKKKDLINAYKLRIQLAKENILTNKRVDYWRYRAEKDLDSIVELAKDKALALYLKVNFYEDLKHLRFFKGDKVYTNKAISNCKKVVELSKERTDNLGKTLTYLYEMKLVSLYSNEESEEGILQAMKIAVLHPDKPSSDKLKKGLKYINSFAFMYVDVLRDNLRKGLK